MCRQSVVDKVPCVCDAPENGGRCTYKVWDWVGQGEDDGKHTRQPQSWTKDVESNAHGEQRWVSRVEKAMDLGEDDCQMRSEDIRSGRKGGRESTGAVWGKSGDGFMTSSLCGGGGTCWVLGAGACSLRAATSARASSAGCSTPPTTTRDAGGRRQYWGDAGMAGECLEGEHGCLAVFAGHLG